jgi:Ricin-type beta-trefoil lectin domain
MNTRIFVSGVVMAMVALVSPMAMSAASAGPAQEDPTADAASAEPAQEDGTAVTIPEYVGIEEQCGHNTCYTFRSVRFPGKCLDVDVHGGGRNGSKVQLWDCNGQNQQKWLYVAYPLANSTVSWKFGRCLDVDITAGNRNGTKVQLWSCNQQPQQDCL